MTTPTLMDTMIAATITVLSNGLGGLPFVFTKNVPKNIARLGWAVSGGLMLSASVFSLIIPGVNDAGIIPVAIGILLGAGLMVMTTLWLDDHEFNMEGVSEAGGKKIILVLATLFIHSFPEGIAIGVAYGSGEVELGILIAIAIAIHNIPGVPQLIAAVPAYLAVKAFRPILPYAFGFAAGAMLLLVLSEMIPESRANEHERLSSAVAGILGFLMMMVFQTIDVV